MQSCPAPHQLQASDKMTGSNPVSPGSSAELSPFDLSGEMGDTACGSPTYDGMDGSQQDNSGGQKWDGQSEIAEQAKHEAEIENRIAELRKEGFWTPRRLSKVPEPTRPKVLWDYLCEEMQWLSADFAQERRWKRGVARKLVRMVVRHHEELKQKEERARREEQAKLRRIATTIAKEVRQFWSNVEKVVQFKQQSRLEEKRKKALDLQLDFIVGQTEKYSDLLSQSLNETLLPVSKSSSSCIGSSQGGSLRTSPTPSVHHNYDGDFLPHDEEDDEETIEIEERQDGNDAESQRLEIELLKKESELPLEELLESLGPNFLQDVDPDQDMQESDSPLLPQVFEEEDGEFTVNEEEGEDEEETIEAEEALEGQQDHAEELSELAKEGELSLEELLQKYSMVKTDEEIFDPSEESQQSDQLSDSSHCENSDSDSEGVEFLVKPEDRSNEDSLLQEIPEPKKEITDIAATAESFQPKGYTLATTQVKTPVPFLLRGELREYQHIGLEWLVTMYEKKLNGILADEMGLGKTIQTISLLAHLACDKGNWGPHLIIVPTSVILNWEMEFKRWCPSFKILTYYGSQKERKLKRQGWTKFNAFHVCITSYQLVLQDHQAFRRKNWIYLILDEAQNIKNFKSQRWQSLLNFNSQRRLLLTGTPLQNSLMELWSLMHFLMPHVFQSHREFKEWFSNPLTGMIEGSQEYNEGLVRRLHKVLRPFLLRRIKLDVEKQMPKKYEHVIYCRLSKRQRFLYDDFMSQAATKETLASGHFMSVINILMQLRKVCNHPNLFDPRPIHSPFITRTICYTVPSLVLQALHRHPLQHVDMSMFDLINMEGRVCRYGSEAALPQYKPSRVLIQEIADSPEPPPRLRPLRMKVNRMIQPVPKTDPRNIVVVNSSRPTQKPLDLPPCTAHPHLPSALHTTPTPSSSSLTGAIEPSIPATPAQATPPLVQFPAGPMAAIAPGTIRPPSVQSSQPGIGAQQRLILTPDMQARLPSGEVISLSQLASVSSRPLQAPAVTKALTLQLQGAKFTLSGAQVRQLGMGQPRPLQGANLPVPPPPGTPSGQGVVKIVVRQATRDVPAAAPRPAQPVRLPQTTSHPFLRVLPGGVPEPASARLVASEKTAPVVASSALTLATSPLLMVSSPAVASRLPSPVPNPLPPIHNHSMTPSTEGSMTPAAPQGVALRLLTTGTSAALQLTNHRSSPPSHTPSPALPNCPLQNTRLPPSSPCQAVIPDSNLCPVLQKIPSADINAVLGIASNDVQASQSFANGNVIGSNTVVLPQSPVTKEPTDSAACQTPSPLLPTLCMPGTSSDPGFCVSPLLNNMSLNPPSPPVMSSLNHNLNTPKLVPPTYNFSLVPALLTNSVSSTASNFNPVPTRFISSPVSLLALSALPSANSSATPILYPHPTASPVPSLSSSSFVPQIQANPSPASASNTLPTPLPSVTVNTTNASAPLPMLNASLSLPISTLSSNVPVPLSPLVQSASGNLSLIAATSVSSPLFSLTSSAPLSLPLAFANTPLPAVESSTQLPAQAPVAATAAAAQAPFAAPVVAAVASPVATTQASLAGQSVAAQAPLAAAQTQVATPAAAALAPVACPPPLTPPATIQTPIPLAAPSQTPLTAPTPVLVSTAQSPGPLANPAADHCSLALLSQVPVSLAAPAPAQATLTPQGTLPLGTSTSVQATPAIASLAAQLTTAAPPQAFVTLTPVASAQVPVAAQSQVPVAAQSQVPVAAQSQVPVSLAAPAEVPLASPTQVAFPLTAPAVVASPVQVPVTLTSSSLPPSLSPLCSLPTSSSAPLMKTSAPVSPLVASASLLMAASDSPPTVTVSSPVPSFATSIPALGASVQLPLQLSAVPAHIPSAPAHMPLLAASAPTPIPSLASRASAPLTPLAAYASVPLPTLSANVSAPLASPLPSSSSTIYTTQSFSAPTAHLSSNSVFTVITTSSLTLGTSASSSTSFPLTSCVSDPGPSLVSPFSVPLTPSAPSPVTAPDPPLSLSIDGPSSFSVTLGTASEADLMLDGDAPHPTNALLLHASRLRRQLPPPPRSPFYLEPLENRRRRHKLERLDRIFHLNERRCKLTPVYGTEVLHFCTLRNTDWRLGFPNEFPSPQNLHNYWLQSDALNKFILTPAQRLGQLGPIIERFIVAMPPVEAPQITLHTSHPPPSMLLQESIFRESLRRELTPHSRCLHRIVSNMRSQFPDLRLIQYDCGKLQTLDRLLRQLKTGGHRVLLFTQMTRMLDVLEQFLNYHGHIYLRLDGSTRVEQRQVLMERFNMDRRIFCFILSTRSGGVGVNLTGADTVIFYDSDWNPTMDAQAQDRCHRIGQTRDVHIYRLVSERTVEENILKKAQQKRMLGDMAIEGGNFTTAYFKQQTIRELFDMEEPPRKEVEARAASPEDGTVEDGSTAQNANILEQALCRAEDEEDTLAASLVRAEQVADLAEFNENAPLEAEEEEQSRAEQEINALVEQLTPIERYAMYFLEASLEDISREELKQAEEQVEAARKDLFLAKEDLGPSLDDTWEEESRKNRKVRAPPSSKAPGERVGVRMSERLRGARTADGADLTDGPVMLETSSLDQETLEDNASIISQTENTVPELNDSLNYKEASSSPSSNQQCPSTPLAPTTSPPTETSPQLSCSVKEEHTEESALSDSERQLVPKSDPSPSSAVPQDMESSTPRTPRRKVTADCEILMAGAGDTSPTEKVLRRLPGRLVTVVQERPPVSRRHNRGKGSCPSADPQSPPPSQLSDDTSEAGSPPPKRKRGRPPKSKAEMSPTEAVSDISPLESSAVEEASDLEASLLEKHSYKGLSPPGSSSEVAVSTKPVHVPGSPASCAKLNFDIENSSSVEKRKRGRPPKRREGVATSPIAPSSSAEPALELLSPTDDPGASTTSVTKSSTNEPTSHPIIPMASSNIPEAGVVVEGTSSSGGDGPITPPKRKRGRPPKSQAHALSSPNLHNEKRDSSPDRSPSLHHTKPPLGRKKKAASPSPKKDEEHTASADTDNSSDEEEETVRTPLTRSARTRLQPNQVPLVTTPNPNSAGKSLRGRSPCSPHLQGRPDKRRKPPKISSPSPPSSSPHGSSSERHSNGGRKRHCPPAEQRILRSSIAAPPSSNTRSSRPPPSLPNSPSSHRGRKAKT
ncbi:helicase SRCAP isoform X2 [Xenopus laevis]|uniref:Helicase SRCAP isoform X2 n=1 Tax=Xenopus laevis TaxID=8355 RepID=A0A8J1LWC0_XENLA|nr:helicase SRCAP isoform X2 [Xenopus laevis]